MRKPFSALQILFSAVCFPVMLSSVSAAPSLANEFRKLDRNQDGKLTPDELKLPGAFRTLDVNSDDFITASEAETALKEMTRKNRQKLLAAIRRPGGTSEPSTCGRFEATMTWSEDGSVPDDDDAYPALEVHAVELNSNPLELPSSTIEPAMQSAWMKSNGSSSENRYPSPITACRKSHRVAV